MLTQVNEKLLFGGRERAEKHMSTQVNSQLTIQEQKHLNAPSLILSIPEKCLL